MSRAGAGLAQFDAACRAAPHQLVAGVDEAGRGCLAGPVVAGAAILPPGWCPDGLDDSKRLTARRRDALYDAIVRGALCWGAFAVSPARIDEINILRASLEAMAGALALLGRVPDLVLVDGVHAPEVPWPTRTVVGGDGASAAVAAGAIIAKVTRDRLMADLDARWPGYGFAGHKGYGAAAHLDALHRLGPCPLHRRTFRPVAELVQGRLW